MLSKAFLRRCPYAAYRLGWLYNEGLGVERNPQKHGNIIKRQFLCNMLTQ